MMKILDTFPAFERFWAGVKDQPVPNQISRWASEYMAPWPELLRKQQENYRRAGVSWQVIARRRVFPQFPERFERLRRLHANLVRELPSAWKRTRDALDLDFEVQFVIYVGLGCGAGWATRLGGVPAVLFGLENAADVMSGKRGEWPGCISHEVAHVAHDEWRRATGLPGIEGPRGPYWHLYEEGFATDCERSIGDPRLFGLRTGRTDWLSWCTAHRTQLARLFLRDVRARRSVRRFFGSWYNVQGFSECGYFLGAEVIRELRETLSLTEIARLPAPEIRQRAKEVLSSFARTAH
jgi:hypothetical protein